jgi:hypothetical protein
MGTKPTGITKDTNSEYTIMVKEERSIMGEPNIVRSGKTGIEL